LGVLFLLTFVTGGCSRPAGEILVAPADAPIWPSPPAAARVRYVGAFRTPEDLKPARTFWQELAGKDDEKLRQLVAPNSVAVSPDGQLFVADSDGHCVHVFDLNTRTHTTIGAGTLELPSAVAFGDGHLFVADSAAGAVYVSEGGAALRQFNRSPIQRPAGLAYAPRAARSAMSTLESEILNSEMRDVLVVSDLATAAIHVLDESGTTIRTFPRTSDPADALSTPTHLAFHPAVGLLVTDALAGRIVRYDLDGRRLGTIGSPGDAPGNLALPRGVAVDRAGHIYVVDGRFENVQIFDAAGRVLLAFGQEGGGNGQFNLPAGICIDDRDRVWVADTYNCRVQVFQFLGAPQPPPMPSAVVSAPNGGNSDEP
jgi:sugar lactone lactonase YvrE